MDDLRGHQKNYGKDHGEEHEQTDENWRDWWRGQGFVLVHFVLPLSGALFGAVTVYNEKMIIVHIDMIIIRC
ncbi:MAG: hypothetical protein M3Z66_09295 [Chloroflexota bacterium]|nr:hypothetical protein [Chloroflexota bacterium]